MNTDGGNPLDVTGENLETATEVKLYCGNENPTLWQTLPATYADGKLSTGGLSLGDAPQNSGHVSVTTAGGTATYNVTYESH